MPSNASPMDLPTITLGMPSPAYVDAINQALALIEAHDHSPGKGVGLNQNGITITDDWSMVNHALLNTKAIGLFPQASNLAASPDFASSLFVFGQDLVYVGPDGTAVNITVDGNLNFANVGNTLSVVSLATQTLTASGAVSLSGTLSVTGLLSAGNVTGSGNVRGANLVADSNASIGGVLGVTGQSSFTGDVTCLGGLNVTGMTQLSEAAIGNDLSVAGQIGVSGDIVAANVYCNPGDIDANGGFRQTVGPVCASQAAAATNLPMSVAMPSGGLVGSLTFAWPAPRDGSVTSLSYLHSNVTQLQVRKNGTPLVTHAPTGANKAVAYAKDTYAFTEGDVLTVVYTAGANNSVALYLGVEF